MALGLGISAPISGRLGDKYGTRIMIFIGFLGYAISQVLFATFTDLYALLIVRITAGLFVSSALINMISYLTKVSSKEDRAKVMSYYTGVVMLFMSLAYKFGGELGELMSARDIIYIHAFSCMTIAFLSLLLPNIKGNRKIQSKVKIKDFMTIRLFKIMIIYFLVTMGFTTVNKFMEVYLVNIYPISTVGNFISIMGVITILFTLVVLPYASKKLHELTIMKILLVLGGIAIWTTFALFDNILIGFYTVFIVFNMARSGYVPMHNSYISKADENNQGQIIGISQSFRGIGMSLGPIIGGLIYASNPVRMFNVSAILLTIGFVLLIFIKGEKNENEIISSSNA